MNKKIKLSVLWLAFASIATLSCERAESPNPPRITHLELGSVDSGRVTVGSDLHVGIDIEAGDQIDRVEIRIEQRASETYTHRWDYRVADDAHRGARNAHIHDHIDIPMEAAVGRYDFVVAVSDQNGTRAETRRDLLIEAEE